MSFALPQRFAPGGPLEQSLPRDPSEADDRRGKASTDRELCYGPWPLRCGPFLRAGLRGVSGQVSDGLVALSVHDDL